MQNNKCYLCEEQKPGPMLFDSEHFIPALHQFNNLFLACTECNNVKRSKWSGATLLNPCDPATDVEQELSYSINEVDYIYYPRVVAINTSNQSASDTADLLNAIYQGYTLRSKAKAHDRANSFTNRINQLYKELFNLDQAIKSGNAQTKQDSEFKIKVMLSRNSGWTMPLRSIVNQDPSISTLFD